MLVANQEAVREAVERNPAQVRRSRTRTHSAGEGEIFTGRKNNDSKKEKKKGEI